MALSNRDCPHGRQAGRCSDCDVSELERQIEQDEALIRQLVEALEVLTQDYDDSAVGLEIEAITAGRAWLEGKP